MDKIISILVFTIVDKLTQGKAINNGFTVKLTPTLPREDIKPKLFSALFAKVPQETTQDSLKKEFRSKVYSFQPVEFGSSCTNQVAHLNLPGKKDEGITTLDMFGKLIKLPIIPQPFPDYRIIVATAPWNVKLSGDDSDAKPAVIYIVFPETDGKSKSLNIPEIYFVKSSVGLHNILNKKRKLEPLIIMDSNRTVTGLKSTDVPKFIRFKNKLTQFHKHNMNTNIFFKYLQGLTNSIF